jgi:hypothetical protein
MAAIAGAPNARFPFAQRKLSVFSLTSDEYARLPEWKHGTPRLQGYPY